MHRVVRGTSLEYTFSDAALCWSSEVLFKKRSRVLKPVTSAARSISSRVHYNRGVTEYV